MKGRKEIKTSNSSFSRFLSLSNSLHFQPLSFSRVFQFAKSAFQNSRFFYLCLSLCQQNFWVSRVSALQCQDSANNCPHVTSNTTAQSITKFLSGSLFVGHYSARLCPLECQSSLSSVKCGSSALLCWSSSTAMLRICHNTTNSC